MNIANKSLVAVILIVGIIFLIASLFEIDKVRREGLTTRGWIFICTAVILMNIN